MQKPMETDELILAGRRRPELAVEIFAASLMAIEVDTPAERAYMAELASGLGLAPDVIKKVEQMVGL